MDNRIVTELTADEAMEFFLLPSSYTDIDFPSYFNFEPLLISVNNILTGKKLSDFGNNPKDHDGVNFTLYANKDGEYAWRPLEIIHPALYVSLVHLITDTQNWPILCELFNAQPLEYISCSSLPVLAGKEELPKGAQILKWWSNFELETINQALHFDFCTSADVSNCYGAIYTHSFSWAIHGKESAKADRNSNSLLGNHIDWHIQKMRYGQTNGIPQGSVLMDFLAEIVLRAIDKELVEILGGTGSVVYKILRYRDDYRIFTHNQNDGKTILQALSKVLAAWGMKLNAEKTVDASWPIPYGLKSDRIARLSAFPYQRSMLSSLLQIHDFLRINPNSSGALKQIERLSVRLEKRQDINDLESLISIATDIAYRHPKTHGHIARLLSILLKQITEVEKRISVFKMIKNKLSRLPNSIILNLWLQRIWIKMQPGSWDAADSAEAESPLENVVLGRGIELWNNEWIESPSLKTLVSNLKLLNEDKLSQLPEIVSADEVRVFRNSSDQM